MIAFDVFGIPGPQGSKRFVGRAKSGRGIMVESSAKVKPWREAVKYAALEAMAAAGLTTLDAPIRVRMVFTVPKPASAPKTRTTWPMRKPDGSKLQRSTEDALSDAGLWRDDARVVEWSGAKRYPGEGEDALHVPGVRIRIEVIG
jgi:Holliday junction resolvase RusA-like endonuclease